MFRRGLACYALLFSLLLPTSGVFALTDVQLTHPDYLNPGVDQGKILSLFSCALMQYVQDFDASGLFSYDANRHIAQFDSDFTAYYLNNSGNNVSCNLRYVYIAPCIYTSAQNLDSSGNVYIWLLVYSYWSTGTGTSTQLYLVNSQCYYAGDFSFNSLTYEQIESINFQVITSPSNWLFPIYLKTTSQGNSDISFYLTRNNPFSVNAVSPFFNLTYQQGSLLQLPNHFSISWLHAIKESNQGGSSLPNTFSIFKSRLQNNRCLYRSTDYDSVVFGAKPVTLGVSGYVPYSVQNFSLQTDFDRGGQLDWSEYYRSKDMKYAPDDQPNLDDILGNEEIGSLDPEPIPNQQQIEDLINEGNTIPGLAELNQTYKEIEARAKAKLDGNAAKQLLDSVTTQSGFNRNGRLPSYSFDLAFTSINQAWDFGEINIDFNFLDQEPYKSFWRAVRSLLNVSLFVMTFIACYEIWEKALAWSA